MLFCYSCDPSRSAESRVGWSRAVAAARRYDVTVICGPQTDLDRLGRCAQEAGVAPHLHFERVAHGGVGQRCYDNDLLYLIGYRMWQRRAALAAERLHRQRPFEVAHQVNFCGFREPGFGMRLGIPFVWGPVGGTEMFPFSYLSVTCPMSGAREVLRNVITWAQLRLSRRLRRAVRSSAEVIAATTSAQRAFENCFGLQAEVELEAGLDHPAVVRSEPRDPDRPLRIVWTGRLHAWKGLPLLLSALAKLPPETRFELRVLGEGPCENAYRRRAAALGLDDRIEWVGWGPYEETLPHYQWADAFVFTSLRDTSGAGLLEALGAGAPIIGLHHQGAADLFDAESGVPIKPSWPGETIDHIAAAITRLAADPELLLRLSRGASMNARRYLWSARAPFMEAVYERACGAATVVPRPEAAPVEASGRLRDQPDQLVVEQAGVVG